MKIIVTMKDTDVLQDAIEDAVKEDVAKLNLSVAEAAVVEELRSEDAAEIASKWFEYGEYLTVEIDTNAETIRVLTREELEKVHES